jgi:hypothetical protein
MNSWRDRTSAPVQAQLDRILDLAVTQAQARLRQAHEFDPFALFLNAEERVMQVAYDREGRKGAEVEVIVASLIGQLRAVAPDAQATAVVINSHLSKEKTDAVEIRLEHRSGPSLLVLLRYKRAMFGPNIEFGEFSAFPGTPQVWN